MRLIAKKPCSFGGKNFFIGEEIPECLVASPESQEKLGVLAIAGDGAGEIAAGVAAELKETEDRAYDRAVTIFVNDGTDSGMMAVPVAEDEIRQVFSVLQMNAEEAAKAVSGVESENVLILLHAADSRKTVRDAARKRAGSLPSVQADSGEAGTEGADA